MLGRARVIQVIRVLSGVFNFVLNIILALSGGGLFAKWGNLWYIRGIISASLLSNGECDISKYALYTNAAMHTEWVKRVVRQAKNGYTAPEPQLPPPSEYATANLLCTFMTLEFEPTRILKGVEFVKAR